MIDRSQVINASDAVEGVVYFTDSILNTICPLIVSISGGKWYWWNSDSYEWLQAFIECDRKLIPLYKIERGKLSV